MDGSAPCGSVDFRDDHCRTAGQRPSGRDPDSGNLAHVRAEIDRGDGGVVDTGRLDALATRTIGNIPGYF
jgi:hypothetical protein